MLGTPRHHAPRSGRSFFGLLAVFALLALACFVPIAQAEDAGGIEYQDAPPSATGADIPSVPNNSGGGSEPKGNASSSSDGSTGSETSQGGSEESGSGTAGGSGKNDGNGSGTGPGGKSQVSPAEATTSTDGTPAGSAANSAAAEDDGGSSPLVPILIALAVVMAAAVAAVVIRQRRQRSGGPDGHVSPEAS